MVGVAVNVSEWEGRESEMRWSILGDLESNVLPWTRMHIVKRHHFFTHIVIAITADGHMNVEFSFYFIELAYRGGHDHTREREGCDEG
jgi:hypothetical protein